MSTEFSPRVLRLLEGPNLAHVVTLDRSGAPRVQPTWVSTDGETVWLNSQDGRAWPKRLRRDPRVALSIVNAQDPTEYVEITGTMVQETSEGAKDHLDAVSRVYTGGDYPNHFDGEIRVIFKIKPERVCYVNLLEHVPGMPAPANQAG